MWSLKFCPTRIRLSVFFEVDRHFWHPINNTSTILKLKRRYQVAFRAPNFFEILGREFDLIEAFPSVFYEIVESDKSIASTSASPSGEFSQGMVQLVFGDVSMADFELVQIGE
jgi:hypothetical protein